MLSHRVSSAVKILPPCLRILAPEPSAVWPSSLSGTTFLLTLLSGMRSLFLSSSLHPNRPHDATESSRYLLNTSEEHLGLCSAPCMCGLSECLADSCLTPTISFHHRFSVFTCNLYLSYNA